MQADELYAVSSFMERGLVSYICTSSLVPWAGMGLV